MLHSIFAGHAYFTLTFLQCAVSISYSLSFSFSNSPILSLCVSLFFFFRSFIHFVFIHGSFSLALCVCVSSECINSFSLSPFTFNHVLHLNCKHTLAVSMCNDSVVDQSSIWFYALVLLLAEYLPSSLPFFNRHTHTHTIINAKGYRYTSFIFRYHYHSTNDHWTQN